MSWLASGRDLLLGGEGQHDVARIDDLILEDERLGDGLVSNIVDFRLGFECLVGSLVLLGGQWAWLAVAGSGLVLTCK